MTRRSRPPHPVVVAVVLIAAAVFLALAPASAQSRLGRDVPRSWPSVADASPTDASPAPANAPAEGCGLLLPGSDATTSDGCLACHARIAHGGHPYGLDYARWRSASGWLRPIDEAQRRGVFLPDRQVRCVTCHDRRSPWKFHMRLPPGSQPTQAVDLRRRVSYENPRALPPPRPGDEVGTKPLCLGCHAVD